jgi:hypothetical protein
LKTIRIEVTEPVFEDFRRASKSEGRPMAEIIREAMESYRRLHLRPKADLRTFRPRSLGPVRRPLRRGDDLLAELRERES